MRAHVERAHRGQTADFARNAREQVAGQVEQGQLGQEQHVSRELGEVVEEKLLRLSTEKGAERRLTQSFDKLVSCVMLSEMATR